MNGCGAHTPRAPPYNLSPHDRMSYLRSLLLYALHHLLQLLDRCEDRILLLLEARGRLLEGRELPLELHAHEPTERPLLGDQALCQTSRVLGHVSNARLYLAHGEGVVAIGADLLEDLVELFIRLALARACTDNR